MRLRLLLALFVVVSLTGATRPVLGGGRLGFAEVELLAFGVAGERPELEQDDGGDHGDHHDDRKDSPSTAFQVKPIFGFRVAPTSLYSS